MKLHIPQRQTTKPEEKIKTQAEPQLTEEQKKKLVELVKKQMVMGCVVIDGTR